ncbi:ribosome small subunit-dependent GTPase A [Thermoflavimicrobium daqui]|jgi:ribosome biogenesis GTPase|uniref:Small ribosomal subunit biogenesis GTPase RsgA n=1 Tax=Thermoflavimicrobium daqui TaxID=2137476 RepID=A0A364K745_9BACL|nr:ribosome small subunit-dependent GTPase A [Thermoflavimicrobium daqui]RAL26125.1 ribosome small subunit-dependent GTPase A [Thermoflavimicrobium daqui]
MPQGQIFKAISGFYYVRTLDGEELECRARGVFKFAKKKVKPLVGDMVEVEKTGEAEGVVVSVEPRQTELLRPPIANVEQAIVVCSLREPPFQQMPLDRFLVHAEREGLEIVICLTKYDLIEDEHEVAQIRAIYQAADYPVVTTSIRTGQGVEELQAYLKDRVSVFAGQSGVGKSSLLNQLLPSKELQTGAVSRKIGRGRHTTRQVELLQLSHGGLVADTPGFSQLTFHGMEAEELGSCFPEIHKNASACRFRGCLHINEPHCAIRLAVENKDMDESRYQHYLQFLQEIKQQPRRY